MLLSKTAKVVVSSNTFQYYKSKGYEFEHTREVIEVDVEDLLPKANTTVEVKCNLCGKVFTRKWGSRLQNQEPDHDTCYECLVEYKRRRHKEKHGVDFPFQRKEVRRKVVETNMERYGYENPNQIPEIKEKIRQTNLERYGAEKPTQNPDVVAKVIQTKFERGTQESSKTQRFICDCVNGKLNYPLYNMSLDVALVEDKIDIEYNGRGHDMVVRVGGMTQEEFENKENNRRHKVINSGWKLIEICVPKDQEVTSEWVKEFVNNCKEIFNITNINYITININTNETQKFTLK